MPPAAKVTAFTALRAVWSLSDTTPLPVSIYPYGTPARSATPLSAYPIASGVACTAWITHDFFFFFFFFFFLKLAAYAPGSNSVVAATFMYL